MHVNDTSDCKRLTYTSIAINNPTMTEIENEITFFIQEFTDQKK